MSKSLFHINQELLQIFEALEESGGEVTPELQEALTIGRHELAVKAENYIHFLKNLEADLAKAKAYKEQIAAYEKRKQNTIDRLKGLLLDAVKSHGEIEAGIFTIKTRKSESITITDANLVPMEFTTIVPESLTISKERIKKAIKEGKEVPGAELTENLNLAIK